MQRVLCAHATASTAVGIYIPDAFGIYIPDAVGIYIPDTVGIYIPAPDSCVYFTLDVRHDDPLAVNTALRCCLPGT